VCTDEGGGCNIGWFAVGEWLEYTVDVRAATTYTLTLRLSCGEAGREISITDADGNPIATNIAVPSTGGWQNWEDVVVEGVALEAGEQVIRITNTGDQDYINMNYFSFEADIVPPVVEITSPLNGSEFNASETVTISANASSSASTIANVAFYANDELLITDDSAPYSFNWSGMTEGAYTIEAIATDTEGISSTETVSVTITPAPDVIYLTAGWNLIGHPELESVSLETALASIWSNVEIVKNFDGFYDANGPAELNSLQEMEFGIGYLVKVSENCELTW